ncbi:IS110 family transposase [bacterium]|jgi:transposase|nr:IS110 family transposase [bacterium]
MDNTAKLRIDQLRRIKKEIRGSKNYLIVGVDIAKEKHIAFFGNAVGNTLLKKMSVQNSKDGFEKLLTKLEFHKLKGGFEKIVFGLEPTANYHKPLAEYLINNDCFVVLVSGNAVINNRQLIDGRWDKNDTKDSANIADLISQGKCLFYDHPSTAIRNLRSLLSLKKKLKKQEHSLRVRIRNHLVAQYFPELDYYFNSLESECLAIVKHCFDPNRISQMKFQEFLIYIAPNQKHIGQQNKLKVIWELAKESIGCRIDQAIEFEAGVLVDSLKQIRNFQKEVDKNIHKECLKSPEYKFLLSIPGFGPTISAVILAAIGSAERFENGRQVLKLVGLDLSANRSGKMSANAIARISKKGKSDARYALYQAALVASSRNKDFMAYFNYKLKGREKEKGIRTKMRVKLSAKLLIVAWTLMKKKQNFDPAFLRESLKG